MNKVLASMHPKHSGTAVKTVEQLLQTKEQ